MTKEPLVVCNNWWHGDAWYGKPKTHAQDIACLNPRPVEASAPAAPPDISGEFCSIHGWAVDWDEVHKERFCKKCRAGEPPLNSPSQTSPTDAAIEEAVRVARKALAAWEHWYSVDSTEFNRDTARDMGLSALTTLDAILPILRSGK